VNDGLVFNTDRMVVPMKLQRKILGNLHTSHSGVQATLKLARYTVFWPGITQQVMSMIANCHTCQKFSCSQRREAMQSVVVPGLPFEILSMDVKEVEKGSAF
jgi:hypothetical protein